MGYIAFQKNEFFTPVFARKNGGKECFIANNLSRCLKALVPLAGDYIMI